MVGGQLAGGGDNLVGGETRKGIGVIGDPKKLPINWKLGKLYLGNKGNKLGETSWGQRNLEPGENPMGKHWTLGSFLATGNKKLGEQTGEKVHWKLGKDSWVAIGIPGDLQEGPISSATTRPTGLERP